MQSQGGPTGRCQITSGTRPLFLSNTLGAGGQPYWRCFVVSWHLWPERAPPTARVKSFGPTDNVHQTPRPAPHAGSSQAAESFDDICPSPACLGLTISVSKPRTSLDRPQNRTLVCLTLPRGPCSLRIVFAHFSLNLALSALLSKHETS